jgi:hypothetical protein
VATDDKAARYEVQNALLEYPANEVGKRYRRVVRIVPERT